MPSRSQVAASGGAAMPHGLCERTGQTGAMMIRRAVFLRGILGLALVLQALMLASMNVRAAVAASAGPGDLTVVICTSEGLKEIALADRPEGGAPVGCHCPCAIGCAAAASSRPALASTAVRYFVLASPWPAIGGRSAPAPSPMSGQRGSPRSPPAISV